MKVYEKVAQMSTFKFVSLNLFENRRHSLKHEGFVKRVAIMSSCYISAIFRIAKTLVGLYMRWK